MGAHQQERWRPCKRYLSVEIGGCTIPMLVDTGALRSVLSVKTIKSLRQRGRLPKFEKNVINKLTSLVEVVYVRYWQKPS